MAPKVNRGAGQQAAGEGEHDPPAPLDFDRENKADVEGAQNRLFDIAKIPFDPDDLVGWLDRLEIRAEAYGINSQWTKRMLLELALPSNLGNSLGTLFKKRKTAAGDQIYYECKQLLLKIHGPNPDANFKLALSLVMTGPPSTAAIRLVSLICKKSKPFDGCCCATAVSSIWRDMLPAQIKAQIASMDLEADFDNTIAAADDIWRSMQSSGAGAAVAAVSAEEIAAVGQGQRGGARGGRRGRGRGRGNRGNRQGQAQSQGQQRGPEETPPENCCRMHKQHGKRAFYCSAEATCPWAKFRAPPQDNAPQQ